MPHTKPPTDEEIIRVLAKVAFSETGRRVGENHHKAKLSDAQVDQCFDLQEQGWGTRRIAKHMGAPRSTVCDVLSCRTRSQIAVREKILIVIKRRVKDGDGCV